MNLRRKLFWYRMLTAMTPRFLPARLHWRNKRQRLRELMRVRDDAKTWDGRVADALACPDLAALPRHPQAGEIIGHEQLMHNGLRVALGTYYTSHMQRLLAATKGVHEPQEERVFAETLKHMTRGAVMLELGAYWSFYSMWFQKSVPDARTIMVEPVRANLNAGRLNFMLNGFSGEFLEAYLGERHCPHPYDAPTVSVDWIANHFGLERINLLHSDIQGHEMAMLRGAQRMFSERRIDYVFISTHMNMHEGCRAFLLANGYAMIAEHTIAESHSVDGLLVARRKELQGLDHVAISKKHAGAR